MAVALAAAAALDMAHEKRRPGEWAEGRVYAGGLWCSPARIMYELQPDGSAWMRPNLEGYGRKGRQAPKVRPASWWAREAQKLEALEVKA
jgi:hypothetical protein